MRIGVIGCGSIGRRHIANLLALGERDVMVFDSHEGQKADASGAYDVPLAPRISDLWDWQPTAVLICTPPDSHIRLTAEARIHGAKGIFIEKPLALSPVICADVMADCVTMVGCQWRLHPAFLAVKRLIAEGEFPQPLTLTMVMAYDLSQRPDYRTCYAATTGATMDVAWHLVDLAIWLLGPAKLTAATTLPAERIGLTCDGSADIILRHEGGAVSNLFASFDAMMPERSVRIVGAQGEPDIKMLFQPTDQMYVDELRVFLATCRGEIASLNHLSEATKVLNLLLEAKAWAGR